MKLRNIKSPELRERLNELFDSFKEIKSILRKYKGHSITRESTDFAQIIVLAYRMDEISKSFPNDFRDSYDIDWWKLSVPKLIELGHPCDVFEMFLESESNESSIEYTIKDLKKKLNRKTSSSQGMTTTYPENLSSRSSIRTVRK